MYEFNTSFIITQKINSITFDLAKSIPNDSKVCDTKFKARITSNFEQLKLDSLLNDLLNILISSMIKFKAFDVLKLSAKLLKILFSMSSIF